MSTQTSKSIFLSAQGKLLVESVTEKYTVEGSQCLVRVDYSAINLCDYNFFYMGLSSFITGFEMSGTVEQIGPDSRFQVGDAVFGISPVIIPMPSSHGTHQDLVVARSELLYKIPAGVSSKDASVICMPAHTAADALFNVIGLGLPAAGVADIDPVGKGILIWGGASSVGMMAIQLAKAAGLQYIFTTASAKNHDILRELGATHCFDYRSPSVVEDIQQAQKSLGLTLTLAFDTVGKGVMRPADAGNSSTPELTKTALGDSEGLRLACTLPVHQDPAFGMCTSYRPSGNVNAMGAPQDPESAIRIRKIMEHLLAVKGGCLRLPVVTVVTGAEDGIEGIQRVARVSIDDLDRDRLRHTQAQARLEHLEHLVGLLAEQRSNTTIGVQYGTPAFELLHDSDPREHTIASSSSRPDQPESGATHWSAMLDDIQALRSTLDPLEGNDTDEGDASAPQADVGMGMDVMFGAGLSQTVTIEQVLNTYLPSRRSTDRLVSTYFRVRLYITPYIHSVQFQRQYEAFWSDPGDASPLWISILFSMLFISANISRTGRESEIPGHGFAVAAAQCLALGEYFRPKAFCFEALLLYLHSRFMTCLEISPDMGALLSVLAHIATVSGYHGERSVSSLSPFTAEMRRRAWSSFVQLDLLVSFHLGVPSRITLAASDTRAPRNLLDSDFDEHSARLPSSRPDSELTSVTFCILKHKFMTIFDKILQHALKMEQGPDPEFYQ
ncbi:hypothetical protein LB503_009136 [Fusarium chuoi]|nr:hypothetical protein LB503_009136 [Fusarium chuoi]